MRHIRMILLLLFLPLSLFASSAPDYTSDTLVNVPIPSSSNVIHQPGERSISFDGSYHVLPVAPWQEFEPGSTGDITFTMSSPDISGSLEYKARCALILRTTWAGTNSQSYSPPSLVSIEFDYQRASLFDARITSANTVEAKRYISSIDYRSGSDPTVTPLIRLNDKAVQIFTRMNDGSLLLRGTLTLPNYGNATYSGMSFVSNAYPVKIKNLVTTFKTAEQARIDAINEALLAFRNATGVGGRFSTSSIQLFSRDDIERFKVSSELEAELAVPALRELLIGMTTELIEVDETLARIQADLAPLGFQVIPAERVLNFRISQNYVRSTKSGVSQITYEFLSSTNDSIGYRITVSGRTTSSLTSEIVIAAEKKNNAGSWEKMGKDKVLSTTATIKVFHNNMVDQWCQNTDKELPLWIEYTHGSFMVGIERSDGLPSWSYRTATQDELDRYVVTTSSTAPTNTRTISEQLTSRTQHYLNTSARPQAALHQLAAPGKGIIRYQATSMNEIRWRFFLYGSDQQSPLATLEIYDKSVVIQFTDYLGEHGHLESFATFNLARNNVQQALETIQPGYFVRNHYRLDFEAPTSFWIAIDEGTIAIGMNEETPENTILAAECPRTLTMPITQFGVWTLGSRSTSGTISYETDALGALNLDDCFAALPPLGFTRNEVTGRVTVHGGPYTLLAPPNKSFRPLLEMTGDNSFFIECDVTGREGIDKKSMSVYINESGNYTFDNDILTFNASPTDAFLQIRTPEVLENYSVVDFMGNYGSPVRIHFNKNRLAIQQNVNDVWTSFPLRVSRSVKTETSSNYQFQGSEELPAGYVTTTAELASLEKIGLGAVGTLTMNRFRYTGMTLHDQVLTPAQTGEYIWDTAITSPDENSIQLHGTLLHTNTSETACTATIGLAGISSDVEQHIIITASQPSSEASEVGRIYLKKEGDDTPLGTVIAQTGTPLGDALTQWRTGTALPFWLEYTTTADETTGMLSLGFDEDLGDEAVWSFLDSSPPASLHEVGIGTINTSLTYQNLKVGKENQTIQANKRAVVPAYRAYLTEIANLEGELTTDRAALRADLIEATMVSQAVRVEELYQQRQAAMQGQALQDLRRVVEKAVDHVTVHIPAATNRTALNSLVLDPTVDIQNTKDALSMYELYQMTGPAWTTEQQNEVTRIMNGLGTLNISMPTDDPQPTIRLLDMLANTVDQSIDERYAGIMMNQLRNQHTTRVGLAEKAVNVLEHSPTNPDGMPAPITSGAAVKEALTAADIPLSDAQFAEVDRLVAEVANAIATRTEQLEAAATAELEAYLSDINSRIADAESAPDDATLVEIEERTPAIADALSDLVITFTAAGLKDDSRLTTAQNQQTTLTTTIQNRRTALTHAATKLAAFNLATAPYTNEFIDNMTKAELQANTATHLANTFDTQATLDALDAVGRTDDKVTVAATRNRINANIAARLAAISSFETTHAALISRKNERIATFSGLKANQLMAKAFSTEDLAPARTAFAAAYPGTIFPEPRPVDVTNQELNDAIAEAIRVLTEGATTLYDALIAEIETREAALANTDESILFIADLPEATFATREETIQALENAGDEMDTERALLQSALDTYRTNRTSLSDSIVTLARGFFAALLTEASNRYTAATNADAASTRISELPSDVFDFATDPARPEDGTAFTNDAALLARRKNNAEGAPQDYATTLVAILADANLAIPLEHDPDNPDTTKFNTAAVNSAIDRAYNAIALKRAEITGDAEELRDNILGEYTRRLNVMAGLYAPLQPGQTPPAPLDYARMLLAPTDENVLSLNNVDVLTLATPLATPDELTRIQAAFYNAELEDVSLDTGEVITAFEQVTRAVDDVATRYTSIQSMMQTYSLNLLAILMNQALRRIDPEVNEITTNEIRDAITSGANQALTTLNTEFFNRIATSPLPETVNNLPDTFEQTPPLETTRAQIHNALQNASFGAIGKNDEGDDIRIVDVPHNALVTYRSAQRTRLEALAVTAIETLRAEVDAYLLTLTSAEGVPLPVAELVQRQDPANADSIQMVAAPKIAAARTAYTNAGLSDKPVDDELNRVSIELTNKVAAQEGAATDAWNIFLTEASARLTQTENATSVTQLPSDEFTTLASADYPTADAVRAALEKANMLIFTNPDDPSTDQVTRKIAELTNAITAKRLDFITLANTKITALIGEINTLTSQLPSQATIADVNALVLPRPETIQAAENAFTNAGLGVDDPANDFDIGNVHEQVTRAEKLKQDRRDEIIAAEELAAFNTLVSERIAQARRANNVFPLDHAYNTPDHRHGQPQSLLDTPPYSFEREAGGAVPESVIDKADDDLKKEIEGKHIELQLLVEAAWNDLTNRLLTDRTTVSSFTTQAGVKSYDRGPFNDLVAAARIAYNNYDQSHTTPSQNIEQVIADLDEWYNSYLRLREIEDAFVFLTGTSSLTQRAKDAINDEDIEDSDVLDDIKNDRAALDTSNSDIRALVDAMEAFENKVAEIRSLFEAARDDDIVTTNFDIDDVAAKEQEVELARFARYSMLTHNEAVGAALAKLSALQQATAIKVEAIHPPADGSATDVTLMTQAQLEAVELSLQTEEADLAARQEAGGDITELRTELEELSLDAHPLKTIVSDITRALNNRRVAIARRAMALLEQLKEAFTRPVHARVTEAIDSDPANNDLSLAERAALIESTSVTMSFASPGYIDTTVTIDELDTVLEGPERAALRAQIEAVVTAIQNITTNTDATLNETQARNVDSEVEQKADIRRGILLKDAAAYELSQLEDAKAAALAAITEATTGDMLSGLSEPDGAITLFFQLVEVTKNTLRELAPSADDPDLIANLAEADAKRDAVTEQIPVRADQIAQVALTTLNTNAGVEADRINSIERTNDLPDQAALRTTLADHIDAYNDAKLLAGGTREDIDAEVKAVIDHLLNVVQLRRTFLNKNAAVTEFNILTTATGPVLLANINNAIDETTLLSYDDALAAFIAAAERIAADLRSYGTDDLNQKAEVLDQWIIDLQEAKDRKYYELSQDERDKIIVEHKAALQEIDDKIRSMAAIMHRATLERMELSFDGEDLVTRLEKMKLTDEATALRDAATNFLQLKAWYLEQLGNLISPEETAPGQPRQPSEPSTDTSFSLGRRNSFYAAFNEHAPTFTIGFSYDDVNKKPATHQYKLHIPEPGDTASFSHGTDTIAPSSPPKSRAATEIVTGQTSYLLYVTPIPRTSDCIWHLMYHRGIYLSKESQDGTPLPEGSYLKVRRNGTVRQGGELFTTTDQERINRIESAFRKIDNGAIPELRYVPVWSTLLISVDREFGERVGAMTTIHFTYP